MHRPHPLRTLAVLALLTLAACAGQTAREPFEQGAQRYRFEIDMTQAPDPAADHAVRGAARVTDLASNRVIAAPGFVVAWGESAVLESEDPETGAKLRLDVAVAEDGSTATWNAAVHRGDELIASHQGTVPVKRAPVGSSSPGA